MNELYSIRMTGEPNLRHYGVLGMKWGVRRYQNSDGTLTKAGKRKYQKDFKEKTSIKKGTTIYRTTTNPNESLTGHKYVTTFKEDRNFYTGEGAKWIANTSDIRGLPYEKKYKVTRDLKVATAKDIEDAINRISKTDKNFNEKAAKAYADFIGSNKGVREQKMIDVYYQRASTGKRYIDSKSIQEALTKTYSGRYTKLNSKEKQRLVDRYQEAGWEYINNYRLGKDFINGPNKATSTLYKTAGFGTKEGQELKSKIIEDLKRNGYDAMSDLAGMGGGGYMSRETRQAMIIFDSDKNLKEKATKQITEKQYNKSVKKHDNWELKTYKYSDLHY